MEIIKNLLSLIPHLLMCNGYWNRFGQITADTGGSEARSCLRSKQEGVPIKDTRELILRGEGYDSENDARTAGELYCPVTKGE